MSSSLNRFAVMTSTPPGACHDRTSARLKMTSWIRFRRAFCFAVDIAIGSLSIPIARLAPSRIAAKASTPDPVPRSTIVQLEVQPRVSFSSNRNDMAVVTCRPVPNAAPAGMTRRGGRGATPPPTFVINKRLPIRIGSCSCSCENRFNQSPGSFSIDPPKLLRNSLAFRRRGQAISNPNRLRFGHSMTTNFRPARARRSSS